MKFIKNTFYTLIIVYFVYLLNSCTSVEFLSEERTIVSSIDSANIIESIFFIGDAGDIQDYQSEPVFNEISRMAKKRLNNTLIFLGDNIYNHGLALNDDPDRQRTEHIIREQIQFVQKMQAHGVFIPGNHDWANNREDGFARIKEFTRFVDSIAAPQIEVLPKFGQGGPVSLLLTQNIHFIIFDSQWFLHAYEKDESTSIEAFKNRVKNLSSDSSQMHIFLSHHPLLSNGEHGGHFTWKDHFFPLTAFAKKLYIPLPIIGSLYPIARQNGVSRQDLSNSYYQNYIKIIDSLMIYSKANWIFSGHEHNIQVQKSKNYTQVISGSSTKNKYSACGISDGTLLSHPNNGFAVIDITSKNDVVLRVYTIHDKLMKLSYQKVMNESK